ncbi:MAG: MotA/TolQ/ExbB proton channel family protein [Pirellula sp.]|jgi:biopolymer transport protein ExbB
MDPSKIFTIVGNASYVALAAVALWGAYYVVLVMSGISRKRFKTEELQDSFLASIEPDLRKGRFEQVIEACQNDSRALPQLIAFACTNKVFGFKKVQQLTLDRFQRDVLADLDYNTAWIVTVIKTAPMLGLFGTVVGMMGAFGKLSSAANVNPADLALDIRVALETTAIGLTIAIPLVMCMASITNRIRHMQDLVVAGIAQFLEAFKEGLTRRGEEGTK